MSFFFYDLETSGFNPREARIMQFAGQRTDMELRPIGDPVNVLVKMTDEILPEPDAVLITGITPQATIADGLTEVEFLKMFTEEVAAPGTIFVGYNTVRFDDEFMRCLHYRNFYDPYEWQWKDKRSRWDILDVARMTRALRPDGIQWPFDVNGKPTNRLELLTAMNKLDHAHAHDALSDVTATIEIAQLIYNKQQKLFDYLLSMRDKRKVTDLARSHQPFVYTSGQYPSEFDKTTVAVLLCEPDKKQGGYVYDLRHDPSEYQGLSPDQLAEKWRWKKDSEEPRLPVKLLAYNKCPAVAPLGVLDEASQARLKLDMQQIRSNHAKLKKMKDLPDLLLRAAEIMDGQRQATFSGMEQHVDGRIYDGFLGDEDRQAIRVVRAAKPEELNNLGLQFCDSRLTELLPLYKARNYPKKLSSEEREQWEKFRTERLTAGGSSSRLAKYVVRLQDIVAKGDLTGHQEYLLEELKLYAESIMPSPDEL